MHISVCILTQFIHDHSSNNHIAVIMTLSYISFYMIVHTCEEKKSAKIADPISVSSVDDPGDALPGNGQKPEEVQ